MCSEQNDVEMCQKSCKLVQALLRCGIKHSGLVLAHPCILVCCEATIQADDPQYSFEDAVMRR